MKVALPYSAFKPLVSTANLRPLHYGDLDGSKAYVGIEAPVKADGTSAKLFRQGMLHAYGFNQAEARRNFRAAAELDPDCAMCFWGEAYAAGAAQA